jgi:hypothetical protein
VTDRPPVPAFHPSRLVLVLTRHSSRRGLLVQSPHLPAWGATARSPHELAQVVDQAWTELQLRAYAEQRGEDYDLAPLAETPARPQPTGSDPWAWRELEDGRWLSPGGRRYGADTAVVGKVRAARERQPAAS